MLRPERDGTCWLETAETPAIWIAYCCSSFSGDSILQLDSPARPPEMNYWLVFGAAFVGIAAKAFQQLNVVNFQYWLVMPTSLILAAVEIMLWNRASVEGWTWAFWLALGTGAGLGCMCSMYLHQKFFD